MQHDPEFIAETRAWLKKAHNDLRLAEIVQREDVSLGGGGLFHCQQAAEKALKALLTWNGQTFRKTHSISELGHAVAALAPTLAPLLKRAVILTEYAWRFRYPGDVEEPTPDELPEALALARQIYDDVLAILPETVRPR